MHTEQKNLSIGTLYGKNYFLLKESIKVIKFRGLTFDISHAYPQKNMSVYCRETGKTFELDWIEFLNLAIEAGIGANDN